MIAASFFHHHFMLSVCSLKEIGRKIMHLQCMTKMTMPSHKKSFPLGQGISFLLVDPSLHTMAIFFVRLVYTITIIFCCSKFYWKSWRNTNYLFGFILFFVTKSACFTWRKHLMIVRKSNMTRWKKLHVHILTRYANVL